MVKMMNGDKEAVLQTATKRSIGLLYSLDFPLSSREVDLLVIILLSIVNLVQLI